MNHYIIKKYANRKLYDTREKGYMTLKDLIEKITAGENVLILKHPTGEDITSEVLKESLTMVNIPEKDCLFIIKSFSKERK